MVVVEAAVSGGDRLGSDGGSGDPTISEAEGGGAPGGSVRAREAAVAAPAGSPGRKTTRRGGLARPAKG
jgi:hypothetical protein